MTGTDARTEVAAAVRGALRGQPTLPHRDRLESIAHASLAAWERHDGGAVVELYKSATDVLDEDLALLVSLCAELLRAITALTAQDPEELLSTIVEAS